jgi:hypothetical protein
VVFPYGGPYDVVDPWVLLTVIALATSRIRIGPLVTPVARWRPGTLARQTTSLDRLSGGRLVFGAGLGFTLPAEFGTWGEPVEPRTVAQRLDEGLEVLAGLWSGERVDFRGDQLTAEDVTFRPTPVQRPRPPVWIGCNWPHRLPLRGSVGWRGAASDQPSGRILAADRGGGDRDCRSDWRAARQCGLIRRGDHRPYRAGHRVGDGRVHRGGWRDLVAGGLPAAAW